MIRVILPFHLRNLAHVGSEVTIEVAGPVTQRSVLDALEARYPMLRGTIRDHDTQQRRVFLRFFACEEDLSHQPPDAPLPDAVASGKEPFIVIGAIAGRMIIRLKSGGNIWPCASVTQALPRNVSSSRFSGQCQENSASLWR